MESQEVVRAAPCPLASIRLKDCQGIARGIAQYLEDLERFTGGSVASELAVLLVKTRDELERLETRLSMMLVELAALETRKAVG
jgi:hypothetical protein